MNENGYRIVQILAARPGLVARYKEWDERVDVIALVELERHPHFADGTQQLRALELTVAADGGAHLWVDHSDRGAYGFGTLTGETEAA